MTGFFHQLENERKGEREGERERSLLFLCREIANEGCTVLNEGRVFLLCCFQVLTRAQQQETAITYNCSGGHAAPAEGRGPTEAPLSGSKQPLPYLSRNIVLDGHRFGLVVASP